MIRRSRRTFLKVLSAGAVAAFAGLPFAPRARRRRRVARDRVLRLRHRRSAGGTSPSGRTRGTKREGIIHPASTENTDTSQLKRWVDAPLAEGTKTFELVRPPGSNLVFGPGIGDLADMRRPHHDRERPGDEHRGPPRRLGLTRPRGGIPKGDASRRRASTRCSSNELGREQLLPTVSISVSFVVRGRQPRPARRAAGDRRRRFDQPHALAAAPCTTRAASATRSRRSSRRRRVDLAKRVDVPRSSSTESRCSTAACTGCSRATCRTSSAPGGCARRTRSSTTRAASPADPP